MKLAAQLFSETISERILYCELQKTIQRPSASNLPGLLNWWICGLVSVIQECALVS
jgi:hypothetical protein